MNIREATKEQLDRANVYTEEDVEQITQRRVEGALAYHPDPPDIESIREQVKQDYPVGEKAVYVLVRSKRQDPDEDGRINTNLDVRRVNESEFEQFDKDHIFSHDSSDSTSNIPTFILDE
jgi:hypothetical protein